MTKKKYFSKLDKDKGYFIIKLKQNELKKIQELVEDHLIKRIKIIYPNLEKDFKKNRIYNYHKLSNKINHKLLWSYMARCLTKSKVNSIKKLSFFNNIKKIFGAFKVLDDQDIGYGVMNCRIVRPYEKNDVTPLHADKWFWWDSKRKKFQKNSIMKNKRRIRCWISLWAHKSFGLKGVPFSQKNLYEYKTKFKNGEEKPIFNYSKYNVKPVSFDSTPGNAIIFHEGLLHTGTLNKFNKTRISLEFSMFVNN